MSEQNMTTILDGIEDTYRHHKRNGDMIVTWFCYHKLIATLSDVTSILTTLVINGIASHSSLLDSYVVLHAALVSSLHKIVGQEFGRDYFSLAVCTDLDDLLAAHFVQHIVSSYERHYASTQSIQISRLSANFDGRLETDMSGKECSNLIVLLSELYNFQVISSILVFDIIRGLLAGGLTEFGVELLLKIVRSMFHG